MLALVCSGRPVQTAPVQVSPNKWMFEVPPKVQHLAIFFTQPPPVGYGAAVYHTVNGSDWSFLGCLFDAKPSAIYKISNMVECPSRIGIDIEPLSSLDQLTMVPAVIPPSLCNSKQGPVLKVLENLYNYVMSFTSDPTNPTQAIPIRIFNEWYDAYTKRLQNETSFV